LERCGPESNRRIAVLQTAALPLGYRTGTPIGPIKIPGRNVILKVNTCPNNHRKVRFGASFV
jgi:hypothetical protein